LKAFLPHFCHFSHFSRFDPILPIFGHFWPFLSFLTPILEAASGPYVWPFCANLGAKLAMEGPQVKLSFFILKHFLLKISVKTHIKVKTGAPRFSALLFI